MNLLLDTHALLWALGDPDRLGAKARAAITSRSNTVYASAASAWEIAIKQSLGKLQLPGRAEAWLLPAVARSGLDWLPVTPEDAVRTRALPWHHRDPFDRLLIAQCDSGLVLVTDDKAIRPYGVPLLWG